MIVLVLNFIEFAGKLIAENVEAAEMRPVEVIRAAGGGRMKQTILGVYPQVRPVWIGIFVYGWDIVLRASFILGIVGAGGVGLAELLLAVAGDEQPAAGDHLHAQASIFATGRLSCRPERLQIPTSSPFWL